VLKCSELGVYLVHEAVEVPAACLGKGEAVKEQVHEPGLAAAYATPQVQAALGLRSRSQAQRAKEGVPHRRITLVGCDEALPEVLELLNHR
jgi:hypothetical protein